jgi:hypothetical protein
MRPVTRIVWIAALLAAAVGLPIAGATVAGRIAGDRIYLLNSTACVVAVMSQHDGVAIRPGEVGLIKPGFVDRTPTMLIASRGIWLGGLHFSFDRIEVRDRAEVAIPLSARETASLGAAINLEVTEGELRVAIPGGVRAQPEGFPITFQPGACRRPSDET